jgi:hypothetical protein
MRLLIFKFYFANFSDDFVNISSIKQQCSFDDKQSIKRQL